MRTFLLLLFLLPMAAEAATWYRDGDGDGRGRDDDTATADQQPEGYVAAGGDCDDADPARHPDAVEACDGADNDCDDFVDDADPADVQPWYVDNDRDGFGKPEAAPYRGCAAVAGRVTNDGDCDDTKPEVHPGVPETCDGVDQDCDGAVDDEPITGTTYFVDADGDGWGDAAGGTQIGCSSGEGFAALAGDCDDGDSRFHPRAFEACTAPLADTNCDGSVGDADADQDGSRACDDCDDADAATYPGAPDVWYDGEMNDCDRTNDFDQDGDGYDVMDEHGGDDCDDHDPDVNPEAEDRPGNELDEDCDGLEAVGGCACDAGGAPVVGLFAVAAAALVRRRRR